MANYATQVEVNLQDYFDAASTGQNREEPLAAISPDTWETWFSDWLAVLEPSLPASQGYELSLRLTNDAEIQSFNAQYRHKDQPTDVLAFAALEVDLPLFDVETPEPLYLGDIVISVETAQAQAQQQGHSLRQELAWLAAHALLHLLGWDHPDEESLLKMLQQQESLLQTIGMTSSYHQGEN